MGATLSSRAEWTSASDKGGKLDFSKANEELLVEILRYVEGICKQHVRESTVTFKRPFIWKSSLSYIQFSSFKDTENYIYSESGIVSTARLENGDPHLKITNHGGEIEIQALNFKELLQVLHCAGEKRLREVQLCLEANQDPIAVIMGPAFALVSGVPGQSNTLLEIHERLSREKAMGGGGGKTDELDSSFRLLLLLNNLDLKMLHSSIKQLGKEIRLSPEVVNSEVAMLTDFSGESVITCLKDISFVSDMVFSNGCRAPPWKQVLGDICYIKVSTHEGDNICITASTEGYYVNKGLKDNGDVDGERVGDIFSTLVGLLKHHSKMFTMNIEKQEFTYVKDDEDVSNGEERPAVDIFQNTFDPFNTVDSSWKKEDTNVPAIRTSINTSSKRDSMKRTPADMDKSIGSAPSLKWKYIGLPDDKYSIAQNKVSRKAAKSTGSAKSKRSCISPFSLNQSIGEFYDSESSSEASEDEDTQDRRPESNADLPTEYWQIQKLIKYLRGGNQTSTVIALCSILDFDLSQEASQLAIRDAGGMDLLVNLLETDDVKCKIGTLRILREISKNTQARMAIVDLGGVPMLVEILSSTNRGLKCLAAETIANVAKFRRARRIIRQHGGIKKLVSLLDNPGRPGTPITGEMSDLDVARCAALGLWSCSKSRSNKIALLKTGAVPTLGKLLSSKSVSVLIPVVGTLQECASESTYQELLQSEGMVEHFVHGLKETSTELQKHCAAAIFKCAESEVTRSLVKEHGGLEPLSSLLKVTDQKELLCTVTGAIWKCSKSSENVTVFKSLRAIEQLVSLLSNQPEEVLVNVVGALAECAMKDPDVRATIRKTGGVIPLVQLLTGTNQALLINTTKAVGACALDMESMAVIDKQDGVRLLWSLLKSPNTEVQACAAWAICPCVQNAKDSAELVRSFVGGLELIVGLLQSPDSEVLAGVCAAIAKIAKDEENLGVITDHGVVSLLAKLTYTDDDRLRKNLSDAIARCCMWRNNRVGFGEALAVAPLVSYLMSSDSDVHQSTACALHQLSKDPDNCITMHEAGVVQPLMKMVGSTDKVLQEAAAGCISNIRHLAMANEKEKFQ